MAEKLVEVLVQYVQQRKIGSDTAEGQGRKSEFSDMLWDDIEKLFTELTDKLKEKDIMESALCQEIYGKKKKLAPEKLLCRYIVKIFVYMDGKEEVVEGLTTLNAGHTRWRDYFKCVVGNVTLIKLFEKNCAATEIINKVSREMSTIGMTLAGKSNSKQCQGLDYESLNIGTKFVAGTMGEWINRWKITSVGGVSGSRAPTSCSAPTSITKATATTDSEDAHVVKLFEDGTARDVAGLIQKKATITADERQKIMEAAKDKGPAKSVLDEVMREIERQATGNGGHIQVPDPRAPTPATGTPSKESTGQPEAQKPTETTQDAGKTATPSTPDTVPVARSEDVVETPPPSRPLPPAPPPAEGTGAGNDVLDTKTENTVISKDTATIKGRPDDPTGETKCPEENSRNTASSPISYETSNVTITPVSYTYEGALTCAKIRELQALDKTQRDLHSGPKNAIDTTGKDSTANTGTQDPQVPAEPAPGPVTPSEASAVTEPRATGGAGEVHTTSHPGFPIPDKTCFYGIAHSNCTKVHGSFVLNDDKDNTGTGRASPGTASSPSITNTQSTRSNKKSGTNDFVLGSDPPQAAGDLGGHYAPGPPQVPHTVHPKNVPSNDGGPDVPDLTGTVLTGTTPVLLFVPSVIVALLGYSLWKVSMNSYKLTHKHAQI
ncbi:hypothetical protein AK88_02175 [Plasmodium fragile]|uniref:Schizont-infected cell agglutination extracellular alpha domain-containing protein n=1 Tax=Plasmodium fragile TaxID=5857 RepID=A0A0D9QMS7_PLAFR|nr:uncharacterized protein AK88_02175 [Plasmodium fragile]KJP88228.1 hypothetical protein AK88_02175 [Plasmodium fragile]